MNRFEKTFNRKNTRSVKWDMMEVIYGIEDASDILPMWVADMDFPIPEVVQQALQNRLDHPIFGYSYICEDCRYAVKQWLKNRHDWEVDTNTMLFHHGVIPAMAAILETFTEPGDRILVTPPVYPPFFDLPKKQNREVVYCDLLETDGRYSLDFDKFDEALSGVSVFLLCHPHNPGGIVWSEEELLTIIRLCAKHDVLIVSDEIHADLTLEPHRHTPLAKLSDSETDRIITCIAPTKTFNLAGIQAAVTITSDSKKRIALENHAAAHGNMLLNSFAAVALKAAYEEGGPWLDELKTVISSNMDLAIETLSQKIPGVKARKSDATYLLWIDYRELGLSEKEVMEKLLHRGKVALEPGTKYGKAGDGFLRMNVACPPETLKEGLNRVVHALTS